MRSWLTGSRLVSLPFSDHCEPLVEGEDDLGALCAAALDHRARGRWKYVELRPASPALPLPAHFRPAQTFHLHRVDLRPDLATLRRRLHRDSIQRKIRRAEREHLAYEEGRSEALLRKFRHLLDLTRRRHQAPLQPVEWFQNLIDGFGEKLSIRIASRRGRPVAGILTLTHGRRVVYKYGGSDARLNALGGMPFLFWKAIEHARGAGALELDLGRTDRDNPGLVAFKEHLSGARATLTYWRAPGDAHAASDAGWKMALARGVLGRLPGGLRRAAGRFLYPHIG